MIFDAKRPLAVNGIEDFVTRADLLERALLVRHPPIPEHARRPESDAPITGTGRTLASLPAAAAPRAATMTTANVRAFDGGASSEASATVVRR